MDPWLDDLIALLGPDQVSVDADEVARHSGDKWFAAHPPQVVVFARSTDDVAATLRFCHQHGIPVTARGAGVGYVGGCVPVRGGVALSLARMNRILELNPADGVARVEPGVITGDLQAAARDHGWFYPPDPASLKECSLGGNIATNAGGPRCLKYGVTRHYVLGLTAVLADGTVVRAGGRCHKNKTGFDLVGLFTGSEGLLGVVTEATLRLIPHPQARAMLAMVFDDFGTAAAAVQGVLGDGWLPSAMEVTDSFTLEAARAYLGPDRLPEGGAHLIVEIDGRRSSLTAELGELRAVLIGLGARHVQTAPDEAACEAVWQLRREFSYSLRATGLVKLNEDIVVPRGRLVDLVEFARELQREFDFPVACFGHAGDGNIHVNIMVPDMDDPRQRDRAEQALDRLFRQIIAWDGAITGEHGVGLAKQRWLEQALGAGATVLHKRLKTALDPDGILNPGKMLGGGG